VRLLEEIRSRFEGEKTAIVISGCVGPRGDGYNPSTVMSADEAESYHAEQIDVFAGTAADMITAITMNYVEEALGVVRAARRAGMPAVISFTVETDGKLPTGQTLGLAIEQVDAGTSGYPAYYMINCAHPTHFEHVLAEGGPWVGRSAPGECFHEEPRRAERFRRLTGGPRERAPCARLRARHAHLNVRAVLRNRPSPHRADRFGLRPALRKPVLRARRIGAVPMDARRGGAPSLRPKEAPSLRGTGSIVRTAQDCIVFDADRVCDDPGMRVFDPEERDRVRERVLALAPADPRVVAGAVVGSFAHGEGDRWSDLDLTFGVAEGVPIRDVLDDWTRTIAGELDGTPLFDLPAGSTIYRVFLLPGCLQLDLSVTPASEFGARTPKFRLLFGTAVERPHVQPPSALDLFGQAVHHALRARFSIERGRFWQAEYWVSGVRDQALALACRRRGLPAHYGRGFDDLPADVRDAFTAALARSLDRRLRALGSAVEGLLREAEAREMASKVEPELRTLTAVWSEPG
jgi:hypothetical protein